MEKRTEATTVKMDNETHILVCNLKCVLVETRSQMSTQNNSRIHHLVSHDNPYLNFYEQCARPLLESTSMKLGLSCATGLFCQAIASWLLSSAALWLWQCHVGSFFRVLDGLKSLSSFSLSLIPSPNNAPNPHCLNGKYSEHNKQTCIHTYMPGCWLL